MSENLRILAKYSEAMEAGNGDAVYEFWSEDFHTHVADRVTGGENTDILAHFVGFAVGAGIGALCARLPMPAPGRTGIQGAAGLAAIGILALSWVLALS